MDKINVKTGLHKSYYHVYMPVMSTELIDTLALGVGTIRCHFLGVWPFERTPNGLIGKPWGTAVWEGGQDTPHLTLFLDVFLKND